MLNALLVEITEEDEMYGRKQDRFACAIVRAIQRQHPEAVFVTADRKAIKLSIPEDGDNGIRYTFDIPSKVVNGVIKQFDQGKPLDPEYRTFSVTATEAKPMQNRPHRGANQKKRAYHRRHRAVTKNPIVKTTNRFLDAASEK